MKGEQRWGKGREAKLALKREGEILADKIERRKNRKEAELQSPRDNEL